MKDWLGSLLAVVLLVGGACSARHPCIDEDGDGYVVGSSRHCEGLLSYDCDDDDPRVHPGDADGDGHDACSSSWFRWDCDDYDPEINQKAQEILCDGVDQDCDGEVDELPPINSVLPRNGEEDVVANTFLLVDYGEPLVGADPSVSLATMDGTSVQGQVDAGVDRGSNNYSSFRPDHPLQPDTTYEATVELACTGLETTWAFRTGATGQPVESVSWAGGDFYLNQDSATASMPSWDDGLMVGMYSGYAQAGLHISSVDDVTGRIEGFTAAMERWSGDWHQDFCTPTSSWETGESVWDNPFFQTGEIQFRYTLQSGGDTFPGVSEQTTLSGIVMPDGTALAGVVIDEVFDMYSLDPLLDCTFGEGCACDRAASLGGSPCEECPDGSGPHCWHIVLELIEAEQMDIETVHPLTGEVLDTLVKVTGEDVDEMKALGLCPQSD